MADITMCTSQNCPMMNKCYRVQAQANPMWQSYCNFEYTCNENSGFEDFIRMNTNQELYTNDKTN